MNLELEFLKKKKSIRAWCVLVIVIGHHDIYSNVQVAAWLSWKHIDHRYLHYVWEDMKKIT